MVAYCFSSYFPRWKLSFKVDRDQSLYWRQQGKDVIRDILYTTTKLNLIVSLKKKYNIRNELTAVWRMNKLLTWGFSSSLSLVRFFFFFFSRCSLLTYVLLFSFMVLKCSLGGRLLTQGMETCIWWFCKGVVSSVIQKLKIARTFQLGKIFQLVLPLCCLIGNRITMALVARVQCLCTLAFPFVFRLR